MIFDSRYIIKKSELNKESQIQEEEFLNLLQINRDGIDMHNEENDITTKRFLRYFLIYA